ERFGAQPEISIFCWRIDRLPKVGQQSMRYFEALAQPGETRGLQQRLRQVRRELQIFRGLRQRIPRQFDDLWPVRNLALRLPVALSEFVILAARLLNLVEDQELRVVAQINAARIITGNRNEDFFVERHKDQGKTD